jgi:hypothetical protein
MTARATLLALLLGFGLVGTACESDVEKTSRRRRTTKAPDRTDTSLPMNIQVAFVPPASWERVNLPAGLTFTQPPGFTVVNAPGTTCDANTPPADTPVLRTEISDRWPLTLAMRRGDLARIARANGFTIDSTDIAAHGQRPGDTTIVKDGEGWMLLSGRGTNVLFASVRAPNGCYLVWAARGIQINVDTLGLVLGTVRFGTASR